MTEKLPRTVSVGVATIIAALVTGIATFLAARQTLRVEVSLPEIGKESLSREAASRTIEELSRNLNLAEAEIASLRERQSSQGASDEVVNLRRQIRTLEEQIRSKDVLIASLREEEPSPTPTTSALSDTMKGVRIDLAGCQLAASRVTCSATMTQAREGYNHVVGGSDGSYIWDPHGNQYPLSRVKLGSKEGTWRVSTDLPANVPTRIELVFEGVPSDLKEISALVIATYQQKFTFRNIALSG